MIVRTMVEICAKFLMSRLKIGGAMAISLVAMAAATLILFLDVVFSFTYFPGSFVDSFCSLCLFSEKLGNDDAFVLMTS